VLVASMAAVAMVAAATADLIARRILDERGAVRRRIIGFASTSITSSHSSPVTRRHPLSSQ
jgi:hypothetical protein